MVDREHPERSKPAAPAAARQSLRRLFPAKDRIGARIRRAFKILGATYALSLLIAWAALNYLEADIEEIAGQAEVMSAAAYEMEINVLGSGMAVMKYLNRRDPADIARFLNDEADFQHFFDRYTGLVRTPEERVLADRVEELRLGYFGSGRRLISLRDGLSASYRRLLEFVANIDTVFDDVEMTRIIEGARNKSEASGIVSALRAELAEMGLWLATTAGDQSGPAKKDLEIEIEQTLENLALLEEIAETAESRDAFARLSGTFLGLKSAALDIVAAEEAVGGTAEEFVALRGALEDVLKDRVQVLTRQAITGARRDAERGAELALIVLSALGLILLLVTIGAYRVTGAIVKPLSTLSHAANTLSAGALDHRVPIDSEDEIGDVARAFNTMAAKLQSLYVNLENQVQDRTGELADSNAQLLAELDRRTRTERELVAARDAAQAASRGKSEFLAKMSHELRTPLNAVIGFSELMGMEALGPLGSPRYHEYTKDINDSARHLLSLINDILDLSKVEAGKIVLNDEPIEIAVAIDAAQNYVAPAAATKRIELVNKAARDLPSLRADPTRLHQILLNLLSNAVKFTEAGGRITTEAARRGDGGISITIADTGIGMRPQDIHKALAPFEQVDNSLARKYEGTGLGLPLVDTFLTLHGGELLIESEPGVGTAVTLNFPAERTLGAPAATAAG